MLRIKSVIVLLPCFSGFFYSILIRLSHDKGETSS
jgi:hypothetical protein